MEQQQTQCPVELSEGTLVLATSNLIPSEEVLHSEADQLISKFGEGLSLWHSWNAS